MHVKVFELVLHCHAIGKLLECLTVEGDGHSRVSVKGELHAILDLWLPAILHGRVRVIFIPAVGIALITRYLKNSREAASCLYLTNRRESFLMLTRLLRVFTGS